MSAFLVDRETVKQAVAAGASQVTLTTATRAVRAVPGRRIRTATRAVVMAYLCTTICSTVGPVPACVVFTVRVSSSIET